VNTVTYTASGLMAGRVKRTITEYAWTNGLEVHFDEAGNWFGKAVRVRFEGPEAEFYAGVIRTWLAAGCP
jgi:hypothetical protein